MSRPYGPFFGAVPRRPLHPDHPSQPHALTQGALTHEQPSLVGRTVLGVGPGGLWERSLTAHRPPPSLTHTITTHESTRRFPFLNSAC